MLRVLSIFALSPLFCCMLTGAVVLWVNMLQENSNLHQLVWFLII